MKWLTALVVLAAVMVAGWWLQSGGLERVTTERVEEALLTAGAPRPLAECMAPRMTEKLTITQLRKLEGLRAEQGEAPMLTSPFGLMARIERVGDPEAIEVTARAAAGCAFQLIP